MTFGFFDPTLRTAPARASRVCATASTRLDGPASRVVASARRFFDLQASTIWNDLAGELRTVRGTLLDVGCGAQPYRTLVPPGVQYIGIDTADAKERFCYDMADTEYFTGDRWPVEDVVADTVLCTETLGARPRSTGLPRGSEALAAAGRPAHPHSAVRGTVALRPVRLLALHPLRNQAPAE